MNISQLKLRSEKLDDDDDDDDNDNDDDNNNNKFYNLLRQTYPNVNNAPRREEMENFWREIYGKTFNIMERRAG